MTGVVDIHAHALIPDVTRLVERHPGYATEQRVQLEQFGARSAEINAALFESRWFAPLTDPHLRLALMDDAGIDLQVVSITPTQYHYWAEPSLARDIANAANAGLARLVERAGGRLAAFGTVSLQHPELAIEQLVHAVTVLGMPGVQIGTYAGGRDFSHPALEEFWAAAERLRALVFVHPWGCSLGNRLSAYYLGNIVGQPLETTVALSHLIFAGVLDRYPDVRVCAAHGGGYLPQYLGRADHAFAVRPECRGMAERPSDYVRRLFFDSLVYREDTLQALVAVAGPERVLMGTDFPFDMAVTDPLRRLASLPGDDRAAVAGGTAAALLRLDVNRVCS